MPSNTLMLFKIFLFSYLSLLFISYKTVLNIFLCIPQTLQSSSAFKPALLGALYNKANSPNEDPLLSFFFYLLSIKTPNFP